MNKVRLAGFRLAVLSIASFVGAFGVGCATGSDEIAGSGDASELDSGSATGDSVVVLDGDGAADGATDSGSVKDAADAETAVTTDSGGPTDSGVGTDTAPADTGTATDSGATDTGVVVDTGFDSGIDTGCGGKICDSNATCEPIGGGTCVCNSGWTGPGTTCSDVDECALGTSGCSPYATCTNLPGSYTCTCNPGFTGDGRSCVDIDECSAGTAGCSPYATCTNTVGSYTCTCDPGFSGDGKTCTDIDECATGTAGCDVHATCTNTVGSYTCTCNAGYTGDGKTCTAITPTCTTVEGFETGGYSGWTGISTSTAGTFAAASAHDGAWGMSDSGDWHYRLTPVVGAVGDKLTAWVRGTGGRVYLGFSASASGAKSFVAAPNTSDIRFQDNASWGYTELNTSPQTYVAGHWYKMEIVFGSGGTVTGHLYDSDGTTLLNTVSHTYSGLTTGGIAIRSFGGMDVDTIQFCPGP